MRSKSTRHSQLESTMHRHDQAWLQWHQPGKYIYAKVNAPMLQVRDVKWSQTLCDTLKINTY